MPSWAPAFLVAAAVALAAVPPLRRLAMNTGFVDMPDIRKVHRQPVPYLGGVALILAVLAGVVFETHLSARGSVLVLGAAILGTIGLLDDDRSVSPKVRLMIEVAAAAGAVGLGVRIHASGSFLVDVVITMVWMVGITNAFNLLDNMDGLAAGVAATSSLFVFVLAIFAGQPAVATLAAATAGACLGFLKYNRPPASIFMGDTGSLFLGFVLATLTVNVNSALSPPAGFVIPLMLLGVPVFDTTMVTLARLRRGCAVSEGGKDHLSHRLVARGFSRAGAVWFLVALAAVLGALAALSGRRVIPLWVGVVLAVVTLGVMAALVLPVSVYAEPVIGIPRRVRWAVAAVFVAIPILAAPALVAAARAAGPARDAWDALSAELTAPKSGLASLDVQRLNHAADQFAQARQRLASPVVSAGLAVPALSSNLTALRTLVVSGEQLARTAATLGDLRQHSDGLVVGGTISIDELGRLEPVLAEAADVVTQAQQRLARVERTLLLPPVDDAVGEVAEKLVATRATANNAAAAAAVLPRLLGDGHPRRYLLVFQDSSQPRGTGGVIASWAELSAEQGKLRIERFGPGDPPVLAEGATAALPADFVDRWEALGTQEPWEIVNASPDFPTAAGMMTRLYTESGGNAVDGVIAIDALGLSSLLQVLGPVQVPSWPAAIGADNFIDIALRDGDRPEVFADVSRSVIELLVTNKASLGSVVGALGQARRGGHAIGYFRDDAEEGLMAMLGADGRVGSPVGDSLMVVNQGVSGPFVNLNRHVTYSVRLDPKRDAAAVSGSVEVTLAQEPRSEAPAGPSATTTYVSVYTPFRSQSTTLDGVPVTIVSQDDLGRHVVSAPMDIGGQGSRALRVDLQGSLKLSPDGWYRLDILDQPSLGRDSARVTIAVPRGWRIAEASNARVTGGTAATAAFDLDASRTIWVRLERTGISRVWRTLLGKT